jgi:hypothetical protein
MHDSRLAKIESDVRGFVRASYPEMTIRAEYWAKDRSRIALFFIDERFRTLYRRQRFHYLAHLIPKDDYDSMLADKKERSGTTRITLAAGIAALVGPACAVLPYTDYLPPRLSPDLAGMWLLAAIGAIGIGIGVFALRKGSKVAGTICVLTNIPVLAYWGFIAVFISLGGGR